MRYFVSNGAVGCIGFMLAHIFCGCYRVVKSPMASTTDRVQRCAVPAENEFRSAAASDPGARVVGDNAPPYKWIDTAASTVGASVNLTSGLAEVLGITAAPINSGIRRCHCISVP